MDKWRLCFLDFKLQTSCSQSSSLFLGGIVHVSDKFSNVGMKHDNPVQHYMILLYDIIINSLCILQSRDNAFHRFLHVFLFWYCLGYNSILLSHISRLYPEQPNSEGFRWVWLHVGFAMFPEISMPSEFFWNLKLQVILHPTLI